MRDNKFAMRIKNILSLITFAVAFTVSVAVAAVFSPSVNENIVPLTFDYPAPARQFNKTTADHITRFLEQDIQNGTQRHHEIYGFGDNTSIVRRDISKRAKAISEYANESAAMDDTRLPQDVQLAWLKHMRAWHKYADFFQNAERQKLSYTEIRQMEDQYSHEINQTWYEVLRLAERHGAFVRNN
jgi:hypothetical protein